MGAWKQQLSKPWRVWAPPEEGSGAPPAPSGAVMRPSTCQWERFLGSSAGWEAIMRTEAVLQPACEVIAECLFHSWPRLRGESMVSPAQLCAEEAGRSLGLASSHKSGPLPGGGYRIHSLLKPETWGGFSILVGTAHSDKLCNQKYSQSCLT